MTDEILYSFDETDWAAKFLKNKDIRINAEKEEIIPIVKKMIEDSEDSKECFIILLNYRTSFGHLEDTKLLKLIVNHKHYIIAYFTGLGFDVSHDDNGLMISWESSKNEN